MKSTLILTQPLTSLGPNFSEFCRFCLVSTCFTNRSRQQTDNNKIRRKWYLCASAELSHNIFEQVVFFSILGKNCFYFMTATQLTVHLVVIFGDMLHTTRWSTILQYTSKTTNARLDMHL